MRSWVYFFVNFIILVSVSCGSGPLLNERSRLAVKPPAIKLTSVQNMSESSFLDYDYKRDVIDLEVIRKNLQFRPLDEMTILADFVKFNKGKRHPRVIASEDDFYRIRSLLSSGEPFVTRTVQELKLRAESYLDAPLLPYALDEANLRLTAPHQTQEQLVTLAFIYRLTGDTRFAKKAWDHLENYIGFKDWNPRHFLDVGIMAYSIATVFDWIYETLGEKQKAAFTRAIIDKALIPGLARMNGNDFWHRDANNWNPICNGGLSIAALAILDESEEAKKIGLEVIVKAFQGIPYYIRHFEPDGQVVEGLLYWGYGLENFIRYIETMRTALGSDYGYSDTPGLSKTGYFPLLMSGPVVGLSLGDDPLKIARSDTMFWFARNYRQPFLAQSHLKEIGFYNKYSSLSVEDVLFFDPTLFATRETGKVVPELDHYLRDVEQVSFRENWVDPGALYLSAHGGDNNANHGHLDAGTYTIQGRGKVWALGGLGRDDYTFPGYFDRTLPGYLDPKAEQKVAGRFHFYRLRAEGKNTLVFGEDIRPDQNPLAKAVVTRIKTDADGGFAIFDLSDCYKRDAKKVQRGVMLSSGRKVITITDEFTAENPQKVSWFMHTSADIALNEESSEATLTLDGEVMVVKMNGPQNGRFKIMAATYMSGEKFPLTRNSSNHYLGREIKKLAIVLDDVREGRISVSMSFLENINLLNSFDFVPLSDW